MRSLLILLLAGVTVGCTASISPGDQTESAEPSSASAAESNLTCGPIDLRTPSGSHIDLTGTWRGRGALHYVRQSGSCVWWIALSDIPGQDPGSAHTITFQGELRQDFTLVGLWAFVVRPVMPGTPPSRLESVTFTVEVADVEGQETVTIRGPGAGPNTGGPVADFYAAISLERVGPLPAGR